MCRNRRHHDPQQTRAQPVGPGGEQAPARPQGLEPALLFAAQNVVRRIDGIRAGGVRGGIERWSKLLMPALFLLLALLFVRGMLSEGAAEAQAVDQ